MATGGADPGLGGALTAADAAAIRVLVVPVGRVRAARFWAWARELARCGAAGAVRLEFTTRTGEHEHLEGLQTHRQVLGVVGLADGAACADIGESSAAFAAEVAAHATAVASKCLAFDLDSEAVGVTAVTRADDVSEAVAELSESLVAALNVMAATLEEEEAAGAARRGAELERERMETGGGRLQKLRGDVLLMAGRVADALGAYSAAAEAGETVGDNLWQAAAAEGYCAALVQLAAHEPVVAGAYVSGMPGAAAHAGEGAAGVASGIAELHERVPALLKRCHAVAPILHAEACVRAALAVQAARAAQAGDAEQALQELAQGRASECAVGERRSAVAAWAARAWDCTHELGLADQLRVATAAGAVVASAGLRRRAAFYLRQFVLRAVPALMRAGRAEHSAQTAFPDGAAAFAAVSAQAAAVGPLPAAVLPRNARASPVPDGLKRAVVACVEALARAVAESQWPGLQADVLRACVAAAAALPSPAHAVAAAARLACCLQGAGPAPASQRRALTDEQHLLRSYLQRTAAQVPPQATALGGALGTLLVGLQHVALTGEARPERATEAGAGDAAPALFLHNPSAAPADRERPVLVAGEAAWFVATLRNPLPFALVLSDVALLGAADAGVACTVPAGGEGRVLLPLTPHAASDRLGVRGIRARAFQHIDVECTLREDDAADSARRQRARPLRQRLDAELRSLAGRAAEEDADLALSPLDAGCALNVGVAPALPRLAVAASSAAGVPLSLFEGESRSVELTLANAGVAADWLRVSFEPLSGADARQRDVVDAALAFQLSGAGIGPGGICSLRVRVDGLPALAGACVVVRYGSAQAPGWSRVLRWPLHVSVAPLLVLAREMPVQYYDLPPHMARALAAKGGHRAESDLVSMLRDAVCAKQQQQQQAAEDQFCLAEVGVANVGAADLRLAIEVDLGAEYAQTLAAEVPARAALAHITIPLPRVQLSDAELSAPIPGIEADGGPDTSVFYPWRTGLHQQGQQSAGEEWRRGDRAEHGRQFVVQRESAEDRDVAAQRAAYWTAQALAARVRVRWTCAQSGRTGFVDPRVLLCVDERSLAAVRPRAVQMQIRVAGQAPVRAGPRLLQGRCAAGRPTELAVQLANHMAQVLAPVVSLRVAGRAPEPATAVAAVDAWAHRLDRVERLAVAAVAVPSVDTRLNSPWFRFVPEAAEAPDTHEPAHMAADLDALETGDSEPDLVLDDIEQLILAPIAAGSSSTLSLPLLVATPGRYHVELGISALDGPELVRETLVIDS